MPQAIAWAQAQRKAHELIVCGAAKKSVFLHLLRTVMLELFVLFISDTWRGQKCIPILHAQELDSMTHCESKKILWLSPMCLLDRRSGAAQQVHSVLRTLSRGGWKAHAMQMTLFDGREAYPVASVLGRKYASSEYCGTLFRMQRGGVQHRIFYTRSTDARNLTAEEARSFLAKAKQALEEIQPDVVLTFGSTVVCKQLHKMARDIASSLVFFLANASYEDREVFKPFDLVLVNSEFMRDHYKHKLGIESKVLPELIPPSALAEPHEVIAVTAPAQRDLGFITMVNPSFLKGAPLFARIVLSAARKRPDWTFLAVEGRMTDNEWAQTGLDLAQQPNLWWVPNQQEMRRVYARTSILISPTFGLEAAGRVAIEAQLAGIPVLAANHGGLPEMLNGGGFLFDIPQRYRDHWTVVPEESVVKPWFQAIERLMDNQPAYIEASKRAVRASSHQHPDVAAQKVFEHFEQIWEKGKKNSGHGRVRPEVHVVE